LLEYLIRIKTKKISQPKAFGPSILSPATHPPSGTIKTYISDWKHADFHLHPTFFNQKQ